MIVDFWVASPAQISLQRISVSNRSANPGQLTLKIRYDGNSDEKFTKSGLHPQQRRATHIGEETTRNLLESKLKAGRSCPEARGPGGSGIG